MDFAQTPLLQMALSSDADQERIIRILKRGEAQLVLYKGWQLEDPILVRNEKGVLGIRHKTHIDQQPPKFIPISDPSLLVTDKES